MISHKFLNEKSYNYTGFSKASKIERSILLKMEKCVLEALDYKIYTHEDEYKEYSKYILHLVKHQVKNTKNTSKSK